MSIVIDRVSKSFGEKTVLRDFSLEIPLGGKVCLFGESGSGKTTLIRLLLELIPPDSGTITGVPVKKSAVFQEDRLCDSFTAVRNIRAATGADRSAALAALEALGIDAGDAEGKPVSAFSGGMRRRVAIARAILADSDFVVLDEPFKGLDSDNLKKAAEFVLAGTAEKTVVMVSHSMQEIELIGGKIVYF